MAAAIGAHAAFVDHAAQGDHADFGGAATDVHDHRARRVGDGQARADGRGHGFFDQIHLRGASTQRRFADGATLNLRGAARHTNDDAGAGLEHRAGVNHLDELLEHLLGDREVGDHAVFHRANGFDVAGNFAQHGLGFMAHGLDGFFALRTAFVADRHDRWLIQNDAAVAHINDGVGRAQVNGQVGGKVPTKSFKHDEILRGTAQTHGSNLR